MARVIVAIDPGTAQSAWLAYDAVAGRPRSFGIAPNEQLLERLRAGVPADVDAVVIEEIESFGMAVGREIFATVQWSGRFQEALESRAVRVVGLTRRTVKTHVCGSSKAKDANVRTALVDRFGGQAAAVGTKAAAGPLHGIAKDVWSALAIAVTYVDQQEGSR